MLADMPALLVLCPLLSPFGCVFMRRFSEEVEQ